MEGSGTDSRERWFVPLDGRQTNARDDDILNLYLDRAQFSCFVPLDALQHLSAEPRYVRFASIKTPVETASLLLDIASSKGTNILHIQLFVLRGNRGNRAKDSDVVSTPQHLDDFLPHLKEGLDQRTRNSVYQSLDILNGGQAFLHGNCFEAIPPDDMASCEMIRISTIECLHGSKASSSIEQAQERLNMTRRVVQGVLNVNGFPFLHPVGPVCVRVISLVCATFR